MKQLDTPSRHELVPIEASDYDTIAGWLSDQRDFVNVCGTAFSYPLDRDAFVEFFVEQAGMEASRLCYKWVERDSRSVRGMVSFSRIDWRNDYGHLGFVAVDPTTRSQGIGSAMIESVISLGFTKHGFHRIDLVVLQSNPRALAFYVNRVGFQHEGLMRDVLKIEGKYVGWHSLSVLKAEWLRHERKRPRR